MSIYIYGRKPQNHIISMNNLHDHKVGQRKLVKLNSNGIQKEVFQENDRNVISTNRKYMKNERKVVVINQKQRQIIEEIEEVEDQENQNSHFSIKITHQTGQKRFKDNMNHQAKLNEMLQKQLDFEQQKKEEDQKKMEEEERQLQEFKRVEQEQKQKQEQEIQRLEAERIVREKQKQMDTYNMIIKSQQEKTKQEGNTNILNNSEKFSQFLVQKSEQQRVISLEEMITSQVKLFLKDDDPRKPYYSRKWEEKEEIRHWGQRKLLLVEIWFLMNYGHLSRNVIYAGAAPGMHIEYLSSLFPAHKFYLYDPNEFKLQANNKIFVYQKYFTDVEVEIFQQQLKGDYLFISDVRAANYKELSPEQNERQIMEENKMQMQWVKALKPKKCILKFRCAYPNVISEPTEFFKGDIMIQPWAPQSSTETRIVPNDTLEHLLYDNKKYEEQMFYHNDVTRKEFKIDLQAVGSEGLDGKWDSCAEWLILAQYVKKCQPNFANNLNKTVAKFSRKITKKIQSEYGTRQLSDKKKRPEDRVIRV